jgi:hypothetical protein
MPLGIRDESDFPSPWRPGADGAEPLETPATKPKPANPPPVTTPASLGVIKEIQNEFVDYSIKAEIVADGSGADTSTDFTMPTSKAPAYDLNGVKIIEFISKFTFTGTIQIQTTYPPDATANSLSGYGRGTTATDIKNRDITLGFHESCHRADFQAYLKANALPDPPRMSKGMNEADYLKAVAAFGVAIKKYRADMKADSIQKTDEVGFTLSTSNKTKSTFEHEVP